MTLGEIREKYGVPAEVGMRVGFGTSSRNTIVRASKTFSGAIVIRGPFGATCARPRELTYYNADGEVIWRPGQ